MSYPGGKAGPGTYQRIINQMPPHRVYIEPFLGSGSVLKHKRPAQENIGIELDQTVIEHYHRHPAPGCTLIHGDGIQYLRQRDWKGDELVYCDPPYVEASRAGGRLYNYEMSQVQHQALLETLIDLKAAGVLVMLSGYHSKLYAKALKGWTLITFGSMTRRGMALEHLWMSFPEPLELHDYRFLGEDYRERERIKRKIARWTTKLQDMPALESRALLAALQNLKGPFSSETTMKA